VQAKLVFVVTFWRHDVPLSWRFFSAAERGGFSKNVGLYSQTNMKLSITYKYLKHLHISYKIICPCKEVLFSTGIYSERSACIFRACHHQSWTGDYSLHLIMFRNQQKILLDQKMGCSAFLCFYQEPEL
jgi:hypothetical protein